MKTGGMKILQEKGWGSQATPDQTTRTAPQRGAEKRVAGFEGRSLCLKVWRHTGGLVSREAPSYRALIGFHDGDKAYF